MSDQFQPTEHEMKLLRYLHQRGPMERRSILVDCCSENSLIAQRAGLSTGRRPFFNGSNGAAPMIVARWMKRLIAEGLVAEKRSYDRYWRHLDYHLTHRGETFLRSTPPPPGRAAPKQGETT